MPEGAFSIRHFRLVPDARRGMRRVGATYRFRYDRAAWRVYWTNPVQGDEPVLVAHGHTVGSQSEAEAAAERFLNSIGL